MSKHSLLLVDGDTRSLRVLEVSLRKAGFTVTPASSVQDALDKLELDSPDLIISETTFPDGDGFELRRRVRSSPDWSEIPFVFLTASTAIENKIRGLELGVDDYLTKPIYIKEIITRINILLQKKQRTRFEERRDGRTRFAGRVADMPVIDVIQTIEISRKSGVIQFVGERGRQAAIFFRDGRVIDAEAGALQGEDAVYRLLTWSEGEFEVMFRTVRRREVITTSSQGLLMEGMRRLDEWSRMLEQLPALTHRFEVDTAELAGRLGEVPDDNNRILRLLDGKRTLLEVIDASDCGDLECLQAIARLYFEDLLVDLDHGAPAKRDTGKPMPLVEIEETPTPMEEVASGPHVVDPQPIEPEPEAEVGPLLGGYRPSSLRLIDEAVAAAQAIEPSLFADDPPANGVNGAADGAVTEPIEGDETAQPRRPTKREIPEPVRKESSSPLRREDSGLRMIGSLGRDRAEASGEFVPVQVPPPTTEEPQRELVTILPRRITREMPAVAAPGTTEVRASAFETRTPTGEQRVVESPRTITGENRVVEGRPSAGRSVTPMFDRRGEVPRTVTGEIRALGGIDPRTEPGGDPSNEELRAAQAAARTTGAVRVGTARPGGSDPPSTAPMGELTLRTRGASDSAPAAARTSTPPRGSLGTDAARTSGPKRGEASGPTRATGEIRSEASSTRPGEVRDARTSGEIRSEASAPAVGGPTRTTGEVRTEAARTSGEILSEASATRTGGVRDARTSGEILSEASATRTGGVRDARTSGEIRSEASGPTRTTGEHRTEAARTSGEIRGDASGPTKTGEVRDARTSGEIRSEASGPTRTTGEHRTEATRTSGEIRSEASGPTRTGEVRDARTSGEIRGDASGPTRTGEVRDARTSGEIRGDASGATRTGEVRDARTSSEIRSQASGAAAGGPTRTTGEHRTEAARTSGEIRSQASGAAAGGPTRTTGEHRTEAAGTSGEIRGDARGATAGGPARASGEARMDARTSGDDGGAGPANTRPTGAGRTDTARTTGEVRTDAARTRGEPRGEWSGGPVRTPGEQGPRTGDARTNASRTSGEIRTGVARTDVVRAAVARNNDDPRTNAKRTSGEFEVVARPDERSIERMAGEARATTTGEMSVTAAVESPGPTADAPRVLPPRLDAARPMPAPRTMREGSGVRRRTGPGPRSIVLLCLAGICAAIALYVKVSKTHRHDRALAVADAPVADVELSAPPAEPGGSSAASGSAPALDPAIEMVDAAVKVTAVTPPDAAVPVVAPGDLMSRGDAGTDVPQETKVAQAKALMEKAYAAVEAGEFQKAVGLCDESLKLRRTARTLLLRAQALQKLDRVDDALVSVSDANLVYLQSEKRDYPAGWELKGKILWAAGRFDEARAAYEHFLELDPNGPAAAEARRRLNEPR